MSSDEDRAAVKEALRSKMLSMEEEELAHAIEHYRFYLEDSRIDGRMPHDNEDIAAARFNADLAHAFDHPVHNHQAKIDMIKSADFRVTDVVRPGAVVEFGGRRFVVAVSTTKFDLDGKTYMGISTQSPIYRALEGLAEGETFDFNGRDMTLDTVF